MRTRRPIRPRPVRAALTGVALLSLAGTVALPAGASAASAKAPKVACKPGESPALAGSGKSLRITKSAKGKVRCKQDAKLVKAKVEAPVAAPQGTVASTADQITQALTANPTALAKAEAKIGKKATKALVDRTLAGWRPAAQARATRLAADGEYHFQSGFGDASKGTSGSAKIDAVPAGENGVGIKATATIEFQADASGLKTLGADKLTDGKNAGVKLEIAFEDAPAQCPTAAGRVEGKVSASATLTLTIDGKSTTVSAKVDAKYFLTVGSDARWKTIDGVDVWTTFTYAATGEKSSTWKGNRSGSGFTDKGIFGGPGSENFESALNEQQSHLREDLGGVWGPRGRVLYSDSSTDNIFNYGGSIDHLKGMILTEVATRYLTFAAVEYVRQIVAVRGQKHWLDGEACLKIEGAPDKSRLGPGETTKITTKNARSAGGEPAATNQTATGVASITPASAAVAPGGQAEYTLTAPNTTPVKATWTVVALSPAGKKTITGSLTEAPGYTVILDDRERAEFATHTSSGSLTGKVQTVRKEGGAPGTSEGTGPLSWGDLSAKALIEYSWLENPVTSGQWTATAENQQADQVKISLDFTGSSRVTWTFVNDEPFDPGCDCDPPRVDTPLMPGPMTVALWQQPVVFTVPTTGGTFTYDRAFTTGDGGFFSKGTVTVIPGNS